MIISEYEESLMYCMPTNQFFIDDSNTNFALAIKNSIDDKNMLDKAKSLYVGDIPIVEFNRNNLYYDATM